jgi:hypothetical protein
MKIQLLAGALLLAASGLAAAHGGDGYREGRVISVEPRFVVSFGTRYPDGFSVLYESGGSRYWTHSPYRPGPVIMLPPRPVYYYGPPPHRDWHGHRDWDRRDWDRRHDGRGDRREWRDDRREWRD